MQTRREGGRRTEGQGGKTGGHREKKVSSRHIEPQSRRNPKPFAMLVYDSDQLVCSLKSVEMQHVQQFGASLSTLYVYVFNSAAQSPAHRHAEGARGMLHSPFHHPVQHMAQTHLLQQHVHPGKLQSTSSCNQCIRCHPGRHTQDAFALMHYSTSP